MRHYLQLKDLTLQEYRYIFSMIKCSKRKATFSSCLSGKVVVLVFDKQSTRTRVSFEVGVRQLGGQPVFLEGRTTQMSRGESVEDSAKVISSASDIVVYRTTSHKILEEFSKYSTSPLINGLSDEYHPCQVATDIFTFTECRGQISGKKVAWIGDTNNMLLTWIQAAKIFNFQLNISSFGGKVLSLHNSENCTYYSDPLEACYQGDLITTDVWTSMNYKDSDLGGVSWPKWKVCEGILNISKAGALFLHCLPAHRGLEVSKSVIEGARSVVYLEANNRLWFQKILMGYLLTKTKTLNNN